MVILEGFISKNTYRLYKWRKGVEHRNLPSTSISFDFRRYILKTSTSFQSETLAAKLTQHQYDDGPTLNAGLVAL